MFTCWVLIVSTFPCLITALQCYTCQQGYHSPTPCSNILPYGNSEFCEGSNPECIEAIEWFQNGALQLVRRACWTRSANGSGFCDNYPKKGELKYCKSCTKDNCNSKVIYEPLNQCS